MIVLSGVVIGVVGMPFPIPTETLGKAIAFEYVWKDAGRTFLASKGHFIITVLNPINDPLERLNQARVLTIVAASILRTSSGVGVYWHSADCVIDPNRFLTDSKGVGDAEFASPLWFSFRFYPGSSDPNNNLAVCQIVGEAA